MTKTLAIFGATGTQGGSVLRFVLDDPELSKTYKIRAITRDTSSPAAKELASKVDVVRGDVTNPSTLGPALAGADTVFIMTTPYFGSDAVERELANGKAIVDAAVAQSVSYIIFSTLPPARSISGGKYTAITAYDAKAAIETYIREHPAVVSGKVSAAFYNPAAFMQNFHDQTFLAPRKDADGTWVHTRATGPQTPMPLIDAVSDTGKFVGAILAEPERYAGQTVYGIAGIWTIEEVTKAMAKSTGQKIVFRQVSTEEFEKGLPPAFARIFIEGYAYYEEFGYFGPGQEEFAREAKRHARGKLVSLEEYFEKHPFQLGGADGVSKVEGYLK